MKYVAPTEAEIAAAFLNTNFGEIDPQKYLEISVLKVLLGWRCGSTISAIMVGLGLVRRKGRDLNITAKGRGFLRESKQITCFVSRGG